MSISKRYNWSIERPYPFDRRDPKRATVEVSMTALHGDYLELRPLPESHLPALLKVYQGTPLYFDGLGYDVRRLALADVRAQWQAAQTASGRALLGVYHIVTDLLIGVADVQADAPQPGDTAILLLL